MKANHAQPIPEAAMPGSGVQTLQVIPTRGDSVVIGLDGKYVSVNGEPVDPDTGMPITKPRSVTAAQALAEEDDVSV